ncbi:MAG TPA: tetratricopeptide repeat protein, partial [bacterium (Candidatus Stahlbacteria)]|nr:tetratricopeptide repeat protein [Candidatus Stahlbacteria bacterium]
CLYYNTFYNAKEYYKKALESSPPSKQLLDRCIEKCEKIIRYHPKSDLVPHAIFLMGKCLFEKEEYEAAERKFIELTLYYPKSSFTPKAYIMLGRCYLKGGKFIDARDAFSKAESNRRIREEASFNIVSTYIVSGEYAEAIEKGNEFIKKFPKSRFKGSVFELMGVAYDSLGNFNDAINMYRRALKITTDKLSVSTKIGNDLLALGEIEEALSLFLALRKGSLTKEEDRDIALKIADCHIALNDYKAAVKILEKYPNDQLALYKLGIIYETYLSDLEKAKSYYDKARNRGPSTPTGKEALLKSSAIGKLTQYRDKLDEGEESEAAKTQFLLAETYLLDFKKIDEAITEYQKVIENFPESEYAPKAAYSIAWVLENVKKDDEKAILAYQSVIEKYPNTKYSEKAQKAIDRLKATSSEHGSEQ